MGIGQISNFNVGGVGSKPNNWDDRYLEWIKDICGKDQKMKFEIKDLKQIEGLYEVGNQKLTAHQLYVVVSYIKALKDPNQDINVNDVLKNLKADQDGKIGAKEVRAAMEASQGQTPSLPASAIDTSKIELKDYKWNPAKTVLFLNFEVPEELNGRNFMVVIKDKGGKEITRRTTTISFAGKAHVYVPIPANQKDNIENIEVLAITNPEVKLDTKGKTAEEIFGQFQTTNSKSIPFPSTVEPQQAKVVKPVTIKLNELKSPPDPIEIAPQQPIVIENLPEGASVSIKYKKDGKEEKNDLTLNESRQYVIPQGIDINAISEPELVIKLSDGKEIKIKITKPPGK